MAATKIVNGKVNCEDLSTIKDIASRKFIELNEEQRQDKNNELNNRNDHFWRWVVLLSGCLINFFNTGIIFSWGLYYADIQAKFQVSLTTVSWIGSLYYGFSSVSGLLTPVIIQHLGCRLTGCIGVTLMCGGLIASMFVDNIYILYITLAILPGTGHTMLFLVDVATISQYFLKRRPLALSLVSAGGAVGAVVFPPFVTYLLTTFTLWGTFWLIGGLVMNEYFCSLTLRPPAHGGDHKPTNEVLAFKRKDHLNVLKTPRMLLFLLSAIFQSCVQFIFHNFIPTIAMRRIEGVTLEQASIILTICGVSDVVGRISAGAITTVRLQYVLQFYIVSLSGCGIMSALVTITTTYPLLLVVSAAYGMLLGAMWSLQPSVVHHLFEPRLFTYAYGMWFLASGLANTMGVPFASYLADITEDDTTFFYMATTGFLLAGMCLLPLTFSQNVHAQETTVQIKSKV